MLEKVVFMIENISMMSVNFASLYLPVFFRVTTIDDIQLQQYYSSSSYLPSDPQSIYFTFWGRFRQAFCKKSATYVHQKCVHQSLLRIINWFMHIWCQKRPQKNPLNLFLFVDEMYPGSQFQPHLLSSFYTYFLSQKNTM